MARYAASTTVGVDASRAEIERTLQRYGADQFMYGWESSRAMVEFRMRGKRIRFELPLPDQNAREFQLTPSKGLRRSESEAFKAWEQACRQRWRALNIAIKAKLEAVEVGISEFESEFLANIVLPNNQTVGSFMVPQVEHAYLSDTMPPLLPAHRGD